MIRIANTIILPVVLIAFVCSGAPSRADGEALCPSMSEVLVSKVAAWIKGKGQCKAYCTGCGCKGGPGFRDSQGNCVRWAEVITKCGLSPHRGCRRECHPVVPACADHAYGVAWLKTFAAGVGLAVEFLPADRPDERKR